MIPESIKSLINFNIVSVVDGEGTFADPLVLEVLDSASMSNLKSMMESFVNYEVKVERNNQHSHVSYKVTLKNEKETYYLMLNVSTKQTNIINYLESLINHENNSDKPQTGIELKLPIMMGGLVTILVGLWFILRDKILKCK